MKHYTWLRVSLLLNAAFLAVITVALHRPGQSSPASDRGAAAETSDATAVRLMGPPANSQRPAWVEQLRAAGVEAPVLARVVIADFAERWERRRREMQRALVAGDMDVDDLARFEAQRDIEQENELRAALGEEGFRRWDKTNLLRDFDLARLDLSPTESDALYDLKKDFERRQRELVRSRSEGELDEGDYNDRRMELQNLYAQQLKGAIGDQRYAALQGAAGDGEAAMRHSLNAVNATDAQVAGILDAQRQWNDRRAEFERGLKDNPLTPEEYEVQAHALDAARDEEYKQLLGADGFAVFQKNQDSRYQLMKRYAKTWNLTDQDIDHLYGMLREFEGNSSAYKSTAQNVQQQGQSVDWPGVQQNLHQFTQQTEEAFRAYLGDERFSKLSENNVLELGR